MLELTISQYNLVYNIFSFTFAAMLGSFVFFVLSRNNLAPKYRGAMVMSALVVGIAGYHYLRIFESWSAAFVLVDGMFIEEGVGFNDAYRYVDWALTVPLLVAELVAVIGLTGKKKGWLTFRLATAALLMVVLGYPGEIATTVSARAIWGAISTVPFVYILFVLFTEMNSALANQSEKVRPLFRNTRLLLLATWGFYPIVYMFPLFEITGAGVVVAVQVGYAIADVLAKCGYGFMIYNIAKIKSEEEGYVPGAAAVPAPAAGD